MAVAKPEVDKNDAQYAFTVREELQANSTSWIGVCSQTFLLLGRSKKSRKLDTRGHEFSVGTTNPE